MKKTLLVWLVFVWILSWCSLQNGITSDSTNYDKMKAEIKAEVIEELQVDVKNQVDNKIEKEVNKIEDVVEQIENSVDKVEADIEVVEAEVEDVEDTVDDLDADQDDLENLFDISKIEIAVEWNQATWSFDVVWWKAIWRDYINDDTVTPWREYTVVIRQLDGWWYIIVHDDFDVTLTQQQCSTSNWWEIYAYFASVKDDAWNALEWCANVKL